MGSPHFQYSGSITNHRKSTKCARSRSSQASFMQRSSPRGLKHRSSHAALKTYMKSNCQCSSHKKDIQPGTNHDNFVREPVTLNANFDYNHSELCYARSCSRSSSSSNDSNKNAARGRITQKCRKIRHPKKVGRPRDASKCPNIRKRGQRGVISPRFENQEQQEPIEITNRKRRVKTGPALVSSTDKKHTALCGNNKRKNQEQQEPIEITNRKRRVKTGPALVSSTDKKHTALCGNNKRKAIRRKRSLDSSRYRKTPSPTTNARCSSSDTSVMSRRRILFTSISPSKERVHRRYNQYSPPYVTSRSRESIRCYSEDRSPYQSPFDSMCNRRSDSCEKPSGQKDISECHLQLSDTGCHHRKKRGRHDSFSSLESDTTKRYRIKKSRYINDEPKRHRRSKKYLKCPIM